MREKNVSLDKFKNSVLYDLDNQNDGLWTCSNQQQSNVNKYTQQFSYAVHTGLVFHNNHVKSDSGWFPGREQDVTCHADKSKVQCL